MVREILGLIDNYRFLVKPGISYCSGQLQLWPRCFRRPFGRFQDMLAEGVGSLVFRRSGSGVCGSSGRWSVIWSGCWFDYLPEVCGFVPPGAGQRGDRIFARPLRDAGATALVCPLRLGAGSAQPGASICRHGSRIGACGSCSFSHADSHCAADVRL